MTGICHALCKLPINESFACCFPRISKEIVEVEGNEMEIMAMTSFMKKTRLSGTWAFNYWKEEE